MRAFLGALILFFCFASAALGQWQEQTSGVDVPLRGSSAVSDAVAWASGANGTILRTMDGGKTWKKLSIEGADKLDFRNIRGFDDKTAYVLSIGPGEQSRIYKTADGGQHWQLQFTNQDPKAFYDCFACWDRTHGIAVSDSVDGRFPLITSADGVTWSPLLPQDMPPALPNEGAFAASGTCITTFGKNDVWFATGGPTARVFHSADNGKTWTAAATPILSGAASQGIFSIVFEDQTHGVIVGGDYKQPAISEKNAASTHDGGRTWNLSCKFPSGYRSGAAVALNSVSGKSPSMIVAVGTNGADTSHNGNIWTNENGRDYNAISFAGRTGWAVGSHGLIARVELLTPAPNNELEAVLTEMDCASTSFTTAQADFEWQNYQKVVDETEKQTGKVYFRRSGKNGSNVDAMFEVATPAPKQVLFDSNKVQLYNPKIDQITEYQPGKSKADVDAFLNLGFGGRGHELLKSYEIKMMGWETVDGTRTAKLQLTPLSPRVRSMFSQFILWIDPQRDLPLNQQVMEPAGDYWLSHYTGPILGKKISDDHFHIKTTPNTKIVKPEGN